MRISYYDNTASESNRMVRESDGIPLVQALTKIKCGLKTTMNTWVHEILG